MTAKQPGGRELVFLGPSLDLSRAREICPNAEFRPPIRFGDLYALCCEEPGRVLIIDGVFHDSTPVWQREILQLLRTGWEVLGASSMGALRSMELEAYGMIGIGAICDWYREGRIEGDDEVALMHGIAELGYPPLTLALVDVRHDLAGLERRGALSGRQTLGILSEFKSMGHEARTLEALLALVDEHGGDAAAAREEMSAPGRSIKARDTVLALRVFAGDLPLPPRRASWPDPSPPPHPYSVLEREVLPLNGAPMKMIEALRAMARRPEALERPVRESRRRWFLRDWARIREMGPDAPERADFGLRRAAALARELGVSTPRWLTASAVREDELPEWLAGLAIEDWLVGKTARELGFDRPPRRGGRSETSPIPMALVDWMRRHGVEPPPEECADSDRMAAWLVRMGPEYFGAPDFHPDSELAKTLAANGDLARWSGFRPASAAAAASW